MAGIEIAIGGGDDADIDAGPAPIEPTGFTSRSCNARRSCACDRSTGNAPIFIQKDSVPPLQLPADPVAVQRTGEGAFHVAEEFGFKSA